MSGYEELRDYIQIEGDGHVTTTTEKVYTAYSISSRGREEIDFYSISSRGREEIDFYGTVMEAVDDVLETWPEDDEGDVVIEDNAGEGVVYFARSDADPKIVHVYFMVETRTSWFIRLESYRCHYEPALGGSVRTIIKRLN